MLEASYAFLSMDCTYTFVLFPFARQSSNDEKILYVGSYVICHIWERFPIIWEKCANGEGAYLSMTAPDTLCSFFLGGGGIFIFFVLYSTLLHLPPLRFHCDGGCWDRTQGLLQLRHRQLDALATRLDLIQTHPHALWKVSFNFEGCTSPASSLSWWGRDWSHAVRTPRLRRPGSGSYLSRFLFYY
jgi:hypothetical protein